MSFSSNRLSIYRNKAGLSQAELAEIVGVDTLDIINYEKGVEIPPMAIFAKIAVACDTSVDELTVFGEDDDGINTL